MQVIDSLFDGGEVGRRIEESTVRFGDQERRHVGLVVWFGNFNDQGTVALRHYPGLVEAFDHRINPVVHGRLAVPEVEFDSQAGEVAAVSRHGDVVQLLPERPVPRSPLLQFDRGDAGPFSFFRVCCTARRDQRVHRFEVVEGDLDRRVLARELWIEERKLRMKPGYLDDEHPHLGAPVPEVGIAERVVTEESGDPPQ